MNQTNFNQYQETPSQNNWETMKLSDVIEINDYPSLEKGEVHRYVSMDDLDVYDRKIKNSEEKEYKYSAPRFTNGDTLFPKMSRCLENGKTAFVDILNEGEVAFGSTEFIVMSPTEKILPKFVYYTARRSDVVRKAFKWRNGTTARRQRISTEVFDNIEINVPPIEDQKRIVHILDQLDSKIERLESESEKLERAGAEIFNNYYGNVTDNQFTTKKFSDVADFVDGKAFSQDEWASEGEPIIKIDELNSGVTRRTDRYDNEVLEKYRLEPGDVLFAWSASLGVYYWNKDYGILNQHIFNVVPEQNLSRPFLYFALKESMPEFLSLAHGTTTKHINRSALDEVEVKVLNRDLLDELDSYIKPIFEKMVHNGLEISHLEELRDTLLPKLMSGEIRVNDINLEDIEVSSEV